jgi:type VI secretion system protein ImpA
MSADAQSTQTLVTSVPAVIDLTTLLAPIPGEKPTGENVQYLGVHDEIREARRADDTLAKGDWEHEPKVAEWQKVLDLSTESLTNRTKDLQIAGWMVEALVYINGFVGLRDGLKLMSGLHVQFWDQLYPEMDEGDLEARANALSAMDTRLEVPLKSATITNGAGGVDYSYLQWEDSVKFDFPENLDSLDAEAYNRFAALKAEAEASNRTTAEAFRKAKDSSRRAFYEQLNTLLNECWAEFQLLDKVMDEKFGRQTPGLGTLKKTLDSIRSLVEKLVKEKRILEPDPSLDAAFGGGEGSLTPGGALQGRVQALRQLAEVAQYFQRTEPHSPVAYLIQRAIKWGHMPLELWLEEVIKDGVVLGQLKETLGMGEGEQVASPNFDDSTSS